MRVEGKVVVITGAAGGIGAALARRFAAAGAAGLVLSDVDGAAARALASGFDRATGIECDVTDSAQVAGLVTAAEEAFGPVDLFFSNAGITTGTGLDTTAADWQRAWEVNVVAHIHAARAVLPGMLARGDGYLLQTCSAAGLLTAVGDAPYAVTKHAAVAFAEWLAITYGDRGIKVSALCPQGVRTPMLTSGLEQRHLGALVTAASGAVLTPSEVADAVVDGLAAERFLILPHPEVAAYRRNKVRDPDGWLAAMRGIVARVGSE
jgi:NAD(P)-dependent dehydrogenase (short-subunit alcohol dehydrogenase family)